ERALRCAAALSLPVSLNVSGVDLGASPLPGKIAAGLKRHGLDPALLGIEITESVNLEQEPGALDVLDAIRELGLSVAIDDSGAARRPPPPPPPHTRPPSAGPPPPRPRRPPPPPPADRRAPPRGAAGGRGGGGGRPPPPPAARPRLRARPGLPLPPAAPAGGD